MGFLRKRIRMLIIYFSYIRLSLIISRRSGDTNLFFFFPFYHVGGAERAHIDILRTVSDKKPWVFFTSVSENNAFLSLFKEHAYPIDISKLCYGKYYSLLLEKIGRHINKNKKAIVFGCNSHFFYDLIPLLTDNIKCIDLIHAFSGQDYKAAEDWSLPVVEKIHKRVFISRKAIKDLENQYKENNLPEHLLNRVVYISNQVYIPPVLSKKDLTNLKILYVGRGTPEKRIYLIAQMAKECHELNLPFFFNLAGNVKAAVEEKFYPYLEFKGEISDQEELKKIYEQSHVILITSKREGFPMVVMEGMAHGVIPLCTDVGDISYHIKDGENGIIIRKIDEDEIVKEMLEKLQELWNNHKLLAVLSGNAYNYARNNFGYKRFAEEYKKLFSL